MLLRTLSLRDEKENENSLDSLASPSPEPQIGNIDSVESIALSPPEPQSCLRLGTGTRTRQINFLEF